MLGDNGKVKIRKGRCEIIGKGKIRKGQQKTKRIKIEREKQK